MAKLLGTAEVIFLEVHATNTLLCWTTAHGVSALSALQDGFVDGKPSSGIPATHDMKLQCLESHLQADLCQILELGLEVIPQT